MTEGVGHGEADGTRRLLEAFLKVSENSMVRNLTEGFGDGGFFAEGDGPGSMSSPIVCLAAGPEPTLAVDGDKVVAGKKTVTIKDGTAAFGVAGRWPQKPAGRGTAREKARDGSATRES